METKKLSRTVRRRLNKKGSLQSSCSAETNSPEKITRIDAVTVATEPKKQSKQKKNVPKNETDTKPTLTVSNESRTDESQPISATKSKRKRQRNPESKVVYINSNYGSTDPNSVGGLIQAELVELRKQSENIKTASDLTESQAHVVKRQITRLQGAEKERIFKRPKQYNKTLGEAAKELKQIMEKRKNKNVKNTSG